MPGKGCDTLHTLLLRFSAPLQAWGSGSFYDRRETDDMPTKSGVIGMLAAALGRKRDEPLEDLARLGFGVRVDLPGTKLDDFQITDMGDKRNANLSTRSYLSDAVFLVGLECGDMAFLEKLEEALKHPRFCLFLGRRSCPPTLPLVLGIREGALEQTLREEEWLAPEGMRRALFRFADEIPLRIVIDGAVGDARKKDIPVSFSPLKREYRQRYVREAPAKLMTRWKPPAETEQDPMAELTEDSSISEAAECGFGAKER